MLFIEIIKDDEFVTSVNVDSIIKFSREYRDGFPVKDSTSILTSAGSATIPVSVELFSRAIQMSVGNETPLMSIYNNRVYAGSCLRLKEKLKKQ